MNPPVAIFKSVSKSAIRVSIIAGIGAATTAVLIVVFSPFFGDTEPRRSLRDLAYDEGVAQTTENIEAPIRKEVRDIAGLAAAKGREWDLVSAAEELEGALSPEETGAIAGAIRSLPIDEPTIEMSAVDWNTLLNLLRANNYTDPDFLRFLGTLFREDSVDLEVRDYAVQHTAAWLQSRDRRTGDLVIEDAKARKATHLLLMEAAGSVENSFSGTAASALVDLAGFYPGEFESEKVNRMVRDLMNSEATHPASRITALQLAAERGMTEALPRMRELIRDDDSPPAMKLSAIGGLGQLGDASDLSYLETVRSQQGAERYGSAVDSAIARINARPVQRVR